MQASLVLIKKKNLSKVRGEAEGRAQGGGGQRGDLRRGRWYIAEAWI